MKQYHYRKGKFGYSHTHRVPSLKWEGLTLGSNPLCTILASQSAHSLESSPLIQQGTHTSCKYESRGQSDASKNLQVQRFQTTSTTRREARESSIGTNPANALILDFQPPDLGDNTCLLLKSSIYGTLLQQSCDKYRQITRTGPGVNFSCGQLSKSKHIRAHSFNVWSMSIEWLDDLPDAVRRSLLERPIIHSSTGWKALNSCIQPWDFFGRTDAKAETPIL